MPELPEVEVTRRSVSGIEGARVLALSLGKPLRWPLGCAPESLVGLRVGAVGRRGKYLWLPLSKDCPDADDERRPPPEGLRRLGSGPSSSQDAGTAIGGLLWHLGMSGSLAFGEGLGPSGKHDHAELVTDRGRLRLTDPRRFGAVVWSPGLDRLPATKLLARLGPEPLDPGWTPADLLAALKPRRVAVKLALLSGELVVGAGNIYASDALWEAGIDPRTPCGRIGPLRAARLHAALRRVLGEAIEAGGSTLRDFRNGHGEVGQYQGRARVYGRAGEACTRCGGAIRRTIQGQRATYFCPGCQRR